MENKIIANGYIKVLEAKSDFLATNKQSLYPKLCFSTPFLQTILFCLILTNYAFLPHSYKLYFSTSFLHKNS